jgi:hypothetical protein
MLSIGVSEIRINEESEPQQRTLDQGVVDMVPSITKTTKFNVKLYISLEDKVYLETCYHHCRNPTLGLNVKMQLTLPKVGKWSPSGLPKTQSSI